MGTEAEHNLFRSGIPYLFVASFAYHPAILTWKNLHPGLDIKLVTKEDVVGYLSFSYSGNPIAHLLHKQNHYGYSNIKEILSLLPIADFEKDEELKGIFEDLNDNGLIATDPYGQLQIQGREIYLFEDDEDTELKKFLGRHGLASKDLHFKDLGLEANKGIPNIYLFGSKIEQYFYLFSSLRKDIIANKANPKTIHILSKDEKETYLLTLFSNIFQVPVQISSSVPLLTDNSVVKTIKEYYKNRCIAKAPEKDNSLKQLNHLIDEYSLDTLDFDFGYANLIEVLSSSTSKDPTGTKGGVQCEQQVSFSSGLYYVTDFTSDTFYVMSKDNGVLPDARLVKISANPSYTKTLLDKRLKYNFIDHNRIAFLSSVKIHLDDKIYKSPIIDERSEWSPLDKNGKKISPIKEITAPNLNGLYTQEAEALEKAFYKDAVFAPADKDYKTYDHSFQKIENFPSPKTFNPSGFDDYYDCPYKFYLDKMLGIDGFVANFDTTFGNLAHYVIEHAYDNDFSFDKAWDEFFKTDDYAKSKYLPTPQDEASFAIRRSGLENIASFIHGQKFLDDGTVRPITNECEKTIKKTLWDHYFISGRFDSIVFSAGESGQSYYTILDFKSGVSGTFDIKTVFLGGSLQLPVYLFAIANDPEYTNGATFGGFGIVHIYAKKSSDYVDNSGNFSLEKAAKVSKIAGLTCNDKDYVMSLDLSAVTKNGGVSYRNGSYLKGGATFPLEKDTKFATTSVLKKEVYTYSTFLADAKNAAIKTMDSIKEGLFPIAPAQETDDDDDLPCSFCDYRDICYRAKQDARLMKELIKGHFPLKADEDKKHE
jgi:hypothetical protein